MALFKRFGNYSLFLIWGLFFAISLFFPVTPATLLIGFLFLLYLPGFSLSRLLKIERQHNRFESWMLYLAVGFTVNLLVCWLAIVLQTNILILMIAYGLTLGLLFVLAFIYEQRRKTDIQTNLAWKEIWQSGNLVYLIPVVLVALIAIIMNVIGADFSGDPSYHISIIRKVIDGGRFGIAELAFLKNLPQVQYAYPVWLVFLGLLSKIFHMSNVTIWNEIIPGLVVMAALAWAWIFQKIFNQKLISILAVTILLVMSLANNAFLLSKFPVPDTISKLFLLPMGLALAFEFLFTKVRDWKILCLTTLMLFWAAVIHSTQYVYFFLMLGTFAVFYAAIFWREPNYKETLKRSVWLIITPIVFFLPFLIFLQYKYNVVGDSLAWFAVSKLVLIYGHFKDYEPFVQFAFIILPLSLLFWRRNPKILFLSVTMLIAPVIYYFEPLRDFISLKLSFVLVRRMFSNTVWYYGVLALIAGFGILLLDRLVNLIKSDRLKTIITAIAGILAALVIIFDFKLHWLSNSFNTLFGPGFSRLMAKNFLWIIALLLIAALILVVAQKYFPKINNFFQLESRDTVFIFILAVVFVFWFSADARPLLKKNLNKEIETQQFFRTIPDETIKSAQTEDIGGDDVLAFIKNNLPKRPIFETSSGYRDLPQLVDVYMAAWPGVYEPDKELSNMYRTDTPMNEKFACLSYHKVEYLLLAVESSKIEQLGFGQAPQYLTQVFIKIYQLKDQSMETVKIYKVNTAQIQTDYYFKQGDQPPLCRAPKYREQ